MRADFTDVVFRKARPVRWSVSWSDNLGFVSCASVIGGLVLFEYMAKRVLFMYPAYDFALGALGMGGLIVGIIGLVRAALRRQLAALCVLGVLGGCFPIFVFVVIMTAAMQR